MLRTRIGHLVRSARLQSPGRKLFILVIAAMATLLMGCDGTGGTY